MFFANTFWRAGLPLSAVLAVAVTATPAAAQSADLYSPYEVGKRYYYTISGAAQFPTQLGGSANNGAGGLNSLVINQNTGYSANLAVGARLTPGLRIEFEASYLNAGLSSSIVTRTTPNPLANPNFASAPAAGTSASTQTTAYNLTGLVENLAFLLSAYYDLDTGSPLRPFIGGGLGYSTISFGNVAPSPNGVRPGNSEGLLAYQARAGVNYTLSPETELYVAYRFFGTSSVAIPQVVTGFPISVDVGAQVVHNAELGIRFNI